MKKSIIVLTVLLSFSVKSQISPCDTVKQIGYSVGCHFFCAENTFELNQNVCGWQRITPSGCDTYSWSINNGPPTVTPTIIFTPGAPGITTFSLTGTAMIGTVQCVQSISFAFTVVACTYDRGSVGVDEYEPDSALPIYYNLQGLRVEKKSGELLIEQVGIKRKKIYIYQ